MNQADNMLISKRTLREQIAEVLREKIIRGEIQPGERIIEADIASGFKTSRGPVREALRQIEEEGLISYESHKGCIVKTISYEEMQEKYLIRSTLEMLAVRMYSGNLPRDIEEKMKKTLQRMEKYARKRDLYQVIIADEEFHSYIVEGAKCETLYRIWASLKNGNMAAYYTMNAEAEVPFDVVSRNHEIILNALQQKKPVEEITKLIESHYMVVPELLYEEQMKRGEKKNA